MIRKYIALCIVLIACVLPVVAQQQYATGMDFDDAQYSATPKKARLTRSLTPLPAAASIKAYAPTPGNQGPYGTCTSWATAYCGRTIVEAIKKEWTDKTLITANAYSAAFVFRMIAPSDLSCKGGSAISTALELMKTKGSVANKTLPLACIPSVTEEHITQANNSKIKDYMRLFDTDATDVVKIQAVKKAISEKKPVVFGMATPASFHKAKQVWTPIEDPSGNYGGHAMCAVGYDDNKEGGAFEIQNSWGTYWGDGGYTWIRYSDFAKFTKYAYEFVDLPEPKPAVADLSGEIKLVLQDGKEMPVNLYQSTRGLTVVPAKTAPGPLTLYQAAGSYTAGTRFRIYISNNEPAFVYALSSDLTNAITKIFPNEDGISAALTDRKNNVAIPDEDHFIEFDNQAGKDFLCVLYSREALDINELIKKISAQTGTFSEKIFKVLGEKIVDPKKINFTPSGIGFKAFSGGKNIVPLMVEIEHK